MRNVYVMIGRRLERCLMSGGWAAAAADSMMGRWRWRRCLFLAGIHRARGQELTHILWIVSLFVGLKDGRPREGLAAQCTAEGSLARVYPAVVLHVVAQFERLAAKLALERAVARVRRQVSNQTANVRKGLAAKFAQHDA